ncbi:MAG: 3-phosphoshikimate 1-carboxyvinyltransferase [Anaerolineales bacterium]|nr:3-phosphoshikimate 1-carboxyvinyltransferase [Anaerolineales bacterium]
MRLRSRRSPALRGEVRLPGDKSISHRAALLAAAAEGKSRIEGMLNAGVTRVMLDSLACLGAGFSWEDGALCVTGTGGCGFQPSGGGGTKAQPLYCGNSATTMRLLTGMLAGIPAWESTTGGREFLFDGSEQLRKRPMKRLFAPLCEMGARISPTNEPGRAPFRLISSRLNGIEHRMPVASAQVKTALLLAGLAAEGSTLVEEPSPSRDHTERLLRWLGIRLTAEPGWARVFPLEKPLPSFDLRIPGDFSSAAFLIVAAAIVPGSDVLFKDVGLNPRRTGLLAVLRRMGARIEERTHAELSGEPVGDLRVRAGELAGTVIEGSEVVDMIDEFPALAVAAACVGGTTEVRNAAELRLKESDRISALAGELRAVGIPVEESPDGFAIRGPASIRGGLADARGDHRLAMALAVAGMVSADGVEIDGAESIGESFPDFPALAGALGARLA